MLENQPYKAEQAAAHKKPVGQVRATHCLQSPFFLFNSLEHLARLGRTQYAAVGKGWLCTVLLVGVSGLDLGQSLRDDPDAS